MSKISIVTDPTTGKKFWACPSNPDSFPQDQTNLDKFTRHHRVKPETIDADHISEYSPEPGKP